MAEAAKAAEIARLVALRQSHLKSAWTDFLVSGKVELPQSLYRKAPANG